MFLVGCMNNNECDMDKACVDGSCVNPCFVEDPCVANAECYVIVHEARCQCRSGYEGNGAVRCDVVGCYSNSECPSTEACINRECVNPCLYNDPCAPRAECLPFNHQPTCKCPPEYTGNLIKGMLHKFLS